MISHVINPHRTMFISIAITILALQGVTSQRRYINRCEQSSCYPATGDLLIGREHNLDSSSTCGLRRPERYCIVSHLADRQQKCFTCDTRDGLMDPRFNHSIDKIVSSFGRDRNERWWQAENGREDVSIRLDLEAEFHFTHLIMRFKTFRPAAMFIERSSDFGKTWKVYRYFAHDCAKSFPGVPTGPITTINDVICQSRYSAVEPSTDGEVVFRVLPPYIRIRDPYSEEVQDLLKMTNLRVNFTKLHTLGDNLLDSRPEIKEKYYFAMYDMVVRGSCSCYGHASRCLPLPSQQNNPSMVHGKCECTHNTKGLNCEQCEDFYNDLPWRPARGRETNACKKCECNNHATRCHFDPAVYGLTNGQSGGVCDDCQHNTMGRNCEECKPFFYQVPNRELRDPNICQPCDCDPNGSEHEGECESHSDPENDLVAGRCICKRYVEGRRCDRCIANYWNMTSENPEGCEACACDQLGTIGNYGCNQKSGECRCKRYVTGRQCDTCFPGYYGLSEERDGCKACDCDAGGSYDNDCDQQTGQCKCKPNIVGRRCNQPAPGFYVVNIDYLRYEGEYAHGIENTPAVIREPTPGRTMTWTGPGFMRVSEGDALEFTIDDIQASMYYDIVIRYEPQMPDRWDDVQIRLVRPGPVDERGPCVNSLPQEDLKATALARVLGGDAEWTSGDGAEARAADDTFFLADSQDTRNLYDAFYPGARNVRVVPSSCLEAGVTYTLRFDFNKYSSSGDTPEASVLIDSILLTPSVDSISIFKGVGRPERRKQEYVYYRCNEAQLNVQRSELNEICRQHIFSISTSIYNRAFECDCDQTGSFSGVCEPQGGQCQCKPNVMGRRCDQCVPGYYGFGPEGCQACNCHPIGARDNFCNEDHGQCLCIPNAFGRQCGSCQSGFYGFPNCRRCECNGRATVCENDNGRCINCSDNTAGHNCNLCARGYYGDPRPGSNIGCQACRCPGGADSGYQHGETCRLNTRTNEVVCDCDEGYAGASCSRCAEHYFGNPLVPGGSCEPCQCNNNTDPDVPGSCDPSTGECLKCLYNTEGFSCEVCSPGYYGNALTQSCIECICNILGTDSSAGPCDRETGQCPCLPNVEGERCDRCSANYWKIASGTGCVACNCDPDGSVHAQCNEYTGQCECIPERGGLDCSECVDLYWGDPVDRCVPCDCDEAGSASMQCDRRTGVCICKEGVTGDRCDRCARGTTGELPNCVPCGECYDNWDQIIRELHSEANILIEEGGAIKVGGAPGAFDAEFQEMERRLSEVRDILAGTNVTEEDLNSLRLKLRTIRDNLTESSDDIDQLKQEVDNVEGRIEISLRRITTILSGIDDLKISAEQLRANATNIRELDVSGAFNSTKESQRRSAAAQQRIDDTAAVIEQSAGVRQQTEDFLESSREFYDITYELNDNDLQSVQETINTLNANIVDLNEGICGGRGDPCDAACGGAGCGQCGGLTCGGAVTKANDAGRHASNANETVVTQQNQISTLLGEVETAKSTCEMAHDDAMIAFSKAEAARNQTEGAHSDLQTVMITISEFLDARGATPAEIRQVAEEVLDMSISLTPDEITNLAQQINETIRGLTDIDSILDATRDDLNNAQRLKNRADSAKQDADEVLDTAKRVQDALDKARMAQDAAVNAINDAETNSTVAEERLTAIESSTNSGIDLADSNAATTDGMKPRVEELKVKFVENADNVNKAVEEADRATILANEIQANAQTLEDKYSQVKGEVNTRYNDTSELKSRADALRERAANLFESTDRKINNLREMQNMFTVNENTLGDLTMQISDLQERMGMLVIDIQKAARCHRECESNKPCPE